MLDLKYAFRQLSKNPGFTCVAVLTLGLCIGANLTIFAVLDTVLVRPLPFPESERLVVVENAYPGAGIKNGKATIADYFERRENIDAFESVAMYREKEYVVGDSSSSRRVAFGEVTPEFFETLGVPLALGSAFTDQHLDFVNDAPAVVLTDRYWRDHFDADPEVVGRTMVINNWNSIVIGVLPPKFAYLSSHIELFRPLTHHRWLRRSAERHSQLSRSFDSQMVARLADNRSIAEAQAQIDALNKDWLDASPMGQSLKDTGYHSRVAPLHAEHVRSVKPMLIIVQTGVLFLLTIGCINLASLQLIRVSGRSKELAVRAALGASQWNIGITILLECTMLSLGGGALGVLIGFAGIRAARLWGATLLPLGTDITFDRRIAIAAVVASVVVGICIAIPIIWMNLRAATQNCLQSESRGGTVSRNVQRLRHSFIVAQISLAFVLLCGAGLLGVSLNKMLKQSLGFNAERVLTGHITLPWIKYEGPKIKVPFVRRILEKTSALPGVDYAAVSSGVPFTSEGSSARTILAEGMDAASGDNLRAHYFSYVTPDYFRLMDIPLVKGRFFEQADSPESGFTKVAIIDEALAQQYWPDGDALGRRFSTNISDYHDARWVTVVGIVGNVKQTDLADTEMLGAVYQPYTFSQNFRVVVRTSVPPDVLIPSMQSIVREIDPAMPIDDFKTVQTFIDESLVTRRSPALLAGIFAGVALLLAAIGTYGVLSYSVAQRRREIGVRIALGAMPEQIGRQFFMLGLKLLFVGVLLGIIGAWVAGRAMQSVLFDVPSFHIPTFVATGVVMGMVTLVACLRPSLRAAWLDPVEALASD